MVWEGINTIVGKPDGLFLVAKPVLASMATVLLPGLLPVFLLVAFGAAFFYLQRQWRLERFNLIARNHQLEQNSQLMKRRVSGFGRILSQVVIETDCAGRILFVNGSWQELFFKEDERKSQTRLAFDFIHPADLSDFRKFFEMGLAGNCEQKQRFRLQGSSDKVIPVRISADPVRLGSGFPVTGLRLAFENISREEKKSQALGQKQAIEAVITTILNSFAIEGNASLEQALSKALPAVADLVGANRCLLVNVDQDATTLRPGFQWCSHQAEEVSSFPQGLTLEDFPWLKQALFSSDIVHIPDIAALSNQAGACQKQWQALGLVSVVCLPIWVQGNLVGVLGFGSEGRSAPWTTSDLRLFEVVANVYAGARQREMDQLELKAANRKLESIIEFLPDATFVINVRKEVVAWNRAMEDLTGIPKGEMLGKGDYAYAVPFYGEPLPTLINHFGDADLSQWRQLYNFVEIDRDTLYAESFVPFLNQGQGAFLWLTASALYDEDGQVLGAIQSVRDVTYRKKSEQALRTSEDRYRRLVETMNDGMGVVSSSGLVTFANDSLCQMIGIPKEDLLGVSLDSLFPQIHTRDSLEDWDGWQLSSGEALELDVPRRDGTIFPARVSPAAIVDEEGIFQGGFAIFSDLTKIREAEANIHKLNENLEQRVADSTYELLATNAALRQSEARFRRIIESMQESYIFYSQDTRRVFTYASPSYRGLLGFDCLDDLCASLEKDINLSININARTMAQKSVLGYRQAPWDLHVTCRDGSVKIIEVLEIPVFNKNGHVTSVEGIGRDVTEARQNLDLIKHAQSQLVEQEKFAALGSLVAGLSHEISTPLGIGVTAASHLSFEVQQCLRSYREGGLTRKDFEEFMESSRESSDLIASNLNRAADLLQNFKLVATDQSAEMEREFQLKEYLEDVVRSLGPRLRNTGFNISVDCPDDLEMRCDPGSLYQILSNLIMNSLLHGFEGMLIGQISISVHIEASGIVITYADNGKGMTRGEQARIYEPFFTTKRGRGGTGLGMHIVYNNVTQNLGGKISCASKPGRGTRFTISVPLLAEVEHG